MEVRAIKKSKGPVYSMSPFMGLVSTVFRIYSGVV